MKLNQMLQTNIPFPLTLKKFGGEYDDQFHEGAKTYLYIFIDEKGQELRHYASPSQQENLKLFKEGEKLICLREEKIDDRNNKRFTIYKFLPEDDIQANATQIRGNTAERTMQKKNDEFELQRNAKDLQISIQGYEQCLIAAGHPIPEARRLAIEEAQWVRETASALASVSISL